MTLLSVIIVNYKTKDITLDCLRSIYKYTKDISFEIILVDSNSQDNSISAFEKFAHTHHHFHLIALKENLGFGFANNQGAKIAKGKYLLFLNSDTLLENNLFPKILTRINQSKVDVVSCRLIGKDKKTQQNGGYFPNLWNLFAWQFFLDDLPILGQVFDSIHPKPISRGDEVLQDWVTGAFFLVPRLLFNKLGGFDKNIFMYAEELELCYRIKQNGGIVAYYPDLSISHLGGASSGSKLALHSEIKNLIYFWQKHRPKWQLPFVRAMFFCGSLLRIVLFGIIKNDVQRRQIYTEALRLSL